MHLDSHKSGAKLYAMPFVATLHNPGTDTTRWYIHDIYYLKEGPYSSVASLLDDYGRRRIRRFYLAQYYRNTLENTTLPRQNSKTSRDFANKAPPRTYEPAGPRYRIDGQKVRWMGWELIVSSNMFRGPSIYDVKFKGESVLFENSLTESSLIFGGDSNYDGNAVYLDSALALGKFEDLIKGVDCPEHATYLKTSWWDSSTQAPVTAEGVCVFEADGQEALWRRKDTFAAGLRNNYLIIRYVITLANYDYSVDFAFLLDGKMQTRVTSYGYPQAGFWDDQGTYRVDNQAKDPFGFRVGPYAHGAIHHHTFSFKVDLDVVGRENTFDAIDWTTGDILTALNSQLPQNQHLNKKPPYFLYDETRYVKYNTAEEETGYQINLKNQKFWIVKSEKSRNQWGVERAYRIFPMATGTQTLSSEHPAMDALSFSKYHCIIAKQHDNEKYVTGNGITGKILNGERIRNTDIVAWLNIGFLHVPTSENVPQVVRGDTGFWLKPFNFFDNSSVYDMPQWVNSNTDKQRPPIAKPCAEKPVSDCYFCKK